MHSTVWAWALHHPGDANAGDEREGEKKTPPPPPPPPPPLEAGVADCADACKGYTNKHLVRERERPHIVTKRNRADKVG